MPREATPRTIHLKDYEPPEFLIDKVDLTFDLRDGDTRVHSRLALRRNPASQKRSGDLRLHGEQLQFISLRMQGHELAEDAYSIDAEGLVLVAPPDELLLETEVAIKPEENTALEGLYRSGSMYCTQCEAEGFRRITWFLDRPDVLARFHTRIEADKGRYPVLLSNGNPAAQGELADGRHYAEWDDPHPKPSYLFALVAGDLKHIERPFQTTGGRDVTLRIHVEPENIDKCDHAMDSLERSMRWDEERYGREYDLDVFNIVAVGDFNMGAMENKGLNIFNSKYVLARPDTATDTDFQGIEAVIAHEYFHNWTGNRITCRDWFQLSLKEGFTVYRDQEFSSEMGDRGVKRIEDVRMLRAAQFAEDAGPMAHPVRPASYIEINNFYTVTVYEKGAEVVRMQANLLGPETFRKATDLYFERHDGQAVTTDDFVACMADASGRDLTQFKHWYDYAGTPQVSATGDYDAESCTYRLTLSQSVPDTPGQTNKPPFLIPVAVGLLDDDGTDMPLRLNQDDIAVDSMVLELSEPTQVFEFQDIPHAPTPSLLRGFSAPVKLVDYPYTDAELLHLMAHDTDGFNRWDAAQSLMQRLILESVGNTPDFPEPVLAAFAKVLHDAAAAPALRAEVISLPGLSYLADQMEVVEVDGLYQTREALRRIIAEQLHDELVQQYIALTDTGAFEATPEAIGRRALRNRALGYLAAMEDDESRTLCLAQYQAQANMTDVMAALSLISAGDHPRRDEVIDDFAERWHHDPLVMDKWFAVQAMSPRADTLDRVQGLMSHPGFSIKNPNKVRSLIGAFVGNMPCFHAADGSGYRFFADQVLALDGINPQIAARLVRAMARWRRFDEARQDLMRSELERIVGKAGLSKDVYEIASRSLQ